MTEEEFRSLAEKLRPWTERAMKIEVAPWIRDYVTEMQELYCQLILEKVAYKPFRIEMTRVENYSDLFDDNAQVPNKILAKGDPGMGKTTLAKKIAWDWAKYDFKKVSIVLFLFLKSVQPDDSLEKVMFNQIPELVGLGITQDKLESFIEHYGRQCLLIFDGLDENTMESNKDVLKVLGHEKYLNCNFFLTSRPHSTMHIQKHFDTIVRVDGFTRSEAKKFTLCIVGDKKKVEQILEFNPTGGKQDVALCQCPILLSFICILVKENALELPDKTMPMGEIYTRMIQCLYKKFTLRREIEFDQAEFARVVGLVGKLAWETLLSGDPFFKRSRVKREVGKDAFDYGFLIGNEDLIGDVRADILITFAHRSIHEFFGAFFFVLQLIEGSDIGSILQKADDSIVMKNPLFLHFSFWFLSEKCEAEYFFLSERGKARETLHSFIYSRIHGVLGTEFTKMFPAIDFGSALQTNDNVNLEHFEQILKRFNKIKYLVVGADNSVEWILNHILPTCHALKVVTESEFHESLHCVLPICEAVNGNKVNILLSEKAYRAGILTCLLKKAVHWDRHPVVYLFLTQGESVDLSQILHQEMHQLHLVGIAPARTKVIASGELASATFLTHLSMIGGIIIRKNVMVVINNAVKEGNLPLLQGLRFAGADIRNGLKDLFKEETILLNLTHLDVSSCKNYLRAFDSACKNGLLPKLTSLAISDDKCFLKPEGKDCSWVNFTSLSVKDMTGWSFRQLSKAISQIRLIHLTKLCLSVKQNEKCDLRKIYPETFPMLEHLSVQRCIGSKEALEYLSFLLSNWSLQTLDISHSRGIQGNLSVLMRQHFTSLENLILHDCELIEQDLFSLNRANKKGRLSKLENLDLSQNSHLIQSFGAVSSRWSSLKRLRIDHIPPKQFSTERNGFDMLRPLLDQDCIPLIEELRITASDCFPERTGRWKHLKRLQVVELTNPKLMSMFFCLIESVQVGDLPSLQKVCLLTGTENVGDLFLFNFSRLIQNGVDIYIVEPHAEKIITSAGLE